MADPQHLDVIRQGVKAWNAWREENPRLRADLSEANFYGANLYGANLSRTNLSGANLCRANLIGADLRWAALIDTSLIEASLIEANLIHASLIGANLRRTHLYGANLHGAQLLETIFGNTNLRDVRGLDVCSHLGPSILDHRTLTKSGTLPLSFLRGCGLPDKLIDYLPSLLNEPIQFHSCFISYSTKDQEFAERLHADLQNKGVRCWFAPHKIQGGKKIHEQVYEAIRLYDRLLVILSEHSMESEWVKTEIAHARQKELGQRRKVLFPISLVPFSRVQQWKCFDADTGKDSAREIREYFVPDFSEWKDYDAYQERFDRLLKDLKAEEQLTP